ncbi:histidine kinase [Kitasatospora cineracea]|uniref:sensor histidine kinase n=1 Tax=Kitasatospora cineracea TaxID=88074 RepID=UPI0034431A32
MSLQRAGRAWRGLPVALRDLPLGALLAAAAFVPALRGHGTELGDLPTRAFDALAALAVGAEGLSLVLRRRWPAVSLALVTGGFALDQLRGYHSPAGTALPLALISAGSHLGRYRRTAVVLLSAAYPPLAVALTRLGSGSETPTGFATFYLVLVAAWGVGAWLRSTRAAEAGRREAVAAEVRAAERARIARELHDVVTHHVTAMVIQAEAARYLTADPGRLERSLTAVSDTGRLAIADLRHLLDLLHPDHGTGPAAGPEPRTPVVGRIGTLVEQTRRAGQPVEFTEQGTPPAPAGSADLVVHRVVQESLTNALKYAHGSRTSVRIRYGGEGITVEVSTDGTGTRAAVAAGGGRGLAGLRERVGVLGGEFSAGPEPDGGFTVRAHLPAGAAS